MTEAGPRVIVCAGGGGVGKTTTSAALAIAFARAGRRTLLVTVDPARRLADALGVPIGSAPAPVELAGEAPFAGTLSALMPDPKDALPRLIDLVFEPEQRAAVRANPVVELLVDRLAGIHELVCSALVADAVRADQPEVVVIDTAPSRHALEFVQHPGRLVELLDGRAVEWLGRLAAGGRGETPKGGRLRAWGQRGVEKALFAAFGERFITAAGDLFAALAASRGQLASLARRASELLLGKTARYVLVAGPTRASGEDAAYLLARLGALGLTCAALVINRAHAPAAPFLAELRARTDLPARLRGALDVLADEATARARAVDERVRTLRALAPSLPILELPDVLAEEPSDIVRELTFAVGPALLPHLGGGG